MNTLKMLFKSILESNNGKIHIKGNCWVLSKYYSNDPLIKSKGCRYGSEKTSPLIERKDKNGDTMVLVRRRGVHCPNIIYFEGRPQHANDQTTVCSLPYSTCKKCEHHVPSSSKRNMGGKLIRYPTCKLKKSINPFKKTIEDTGELLGEAIEQTNKMMGGK